MTSPRTVSLRRILGQFHFGITLVAVAMSALTVFLAGIATLRGYAESNLELSSQLGAYAVEPALVFNDPRAARDAIVPLTTQKGIARVEVLDANGRRFADWRREAHDPAPLVSRIFFPEPLETDIVRNGAPLGRLRLWGDSQVLSTYVRAGLLGGLACLLVTALGTVLIARKFVRTITGHIAAIADVAHDARLHRRFHRRVGPLPVSELNRLGKDVNALFDELEGWHRSVEAENERLSRRALHDALTGLANRAGFELQMARILSEAKAENSQVTMFYLDVDRFKSINDRFGHAAGDKVLKSIAERIAALLQPNDLAARLGGDEFVVVTAAHSGATAPYVRLSVEQAISRPVDLGGGVAIVPSASIGVALYPRDGGDMLELLNAADAAMYRAKQAQADH